MASYILFDAFDSVIFASVAVEVNVMPLPVPVCVNEPVCVMSPPEVNERLPIPTATVPRLKAVESINDTSLAPLLNNDTLPPKTLLLPFVLKLIAFALVKLALPVTFNAPV